MFGLCLDEQLGSSKPVRSKATDKLFGEPYRNKGQGVRPIGGRVESPASREVCWRLPESERSLVETSGKAVSKASFGTKSGQHGSLVQLGKLTQRADPEPPEHLGELGQAENLHRKVTEPLRRRRARHDLALARGEPCRERPVGYPHLARWLRGRSASRTGNGHDGRTSRVTDLFGERGLPAEVTGGGPGRYGTGPWPGELHSGSEARNRYDNGFKTARVPRRFLAHHDELRATCLSLPASLAETHPFGPGKGGRGDHPVGGNDYSRSVCKPGGNKRPIRAPDDESARRGHFYKPRAGSHSRPRLGRLAAPRPPTSASSCRELSRP